ncbi:MAG: type II secretion system F family protein, partial [Candidatus Pacearchaeota archaeon]
ILKQIEILNNSIPGLLKNISIAKPISSEKTENENLIMISHHIEGEEKNVAILKKDRKKYLRELQISSEVIKNLKKKRKDEIEEFIQEYKKPRGYIKISNKFFGNSANQLIEKGYFKSLSENLKKGNFTLLSKSYVSVIFFTTMLAGIIGIMLAVFFMFIGISFEKPFIYFVDFSEKEPILRLLKVIWFIPLTPIITFLILYFYPSAEKASLKSAIDYEIPFVTIQMSAIAGADIEPSNIFRIIALSKEYPNIKNEAKKLMNQINLYGYDLTTALKNVAMISPSKNWAELLNGIATTLRSGGNLSKYLDKKAESLLFQYRINREKATKSAETFMDIYIRVVIAAPMMMMLVLIMLSISNIGLGISISVLSIIIISIVALINIVFLMFLHASQKKI